MSLLFYYSFEASVQSAEESQTPALVNQARTVPSVYSTEQARKGSRSRKSKVDKNSTVAEFWKSGMTHAGVPFAYNQGAASDTYWCGISIYIPNPWVPAPAADYEIPLQFHGRPKDDVWETYKGQSPNLEFRIEPTTSTAGYLALKVRSLDKPYPDQVRMDPDREVEYIEQLAPYAAGEWIDLVFAAKFDYRDAYGRTRVWVNKTSVLDLAKGNYYNGDGSANGHGQPYNWLGLYTGWRDTNRSSMVNRIIYHDEYRVAIGDDNDNFLTLVSPEDAGSVVAPDAPLNFRAMA